LDKTPTLGEDGGTKTVDGTVEWAEGSFGPGYNDSLSVQIAATQIIVSLNGTDPSFTSATFNGLDIDAITGTITSAVV
jgi:hypothetical protein